MIISYDNLITRLWLSGAILPYERGGYASALPASIDGGDDLPGRIDTMIDEKGLPPVPHQYWVDRLGFQQDDPVTDFRSGGVSSVLGVSGVGEYVHGIRRRYRHLGLSLSERNCDGADRLR